MSDRLARARAIDEETTRNQLIDSSFTQAAPPPPATTHAARPSPASTASSDEEEYDDEMEELVAALNVRVGAIQAAQPCILRVLRDMAAIMADTCVIQAPNEHREPDYYAALRGRVSERLRSIEESVTMVQNIALKTDETIKQMFADDGEEGDEEDEEEEANDDVPLSQEDKSKS